MKKTVTKLAEKNSQKRLEKHALRSQTSTGSFFICLFLWVFHVTIFLYFRLYVKSILIIVFDTHSPAAKMFSRKILSCTEFLSFPHCGCKHKFEKICKIKRRGHEFILHICHAYQLGIQHNEERGKSIAFKSYLCIKI